MPPTTPAGGFSSWRTSLTRLATLPNLAVKISGLPANCQPKQVNVATLRPYLETTINAFGWDRVVWGGDWPVCTLTTTLAGWIDICREVVAAEPIHHQQKLFSDNARRIYGLRP